MTINAPTQDADTPSTLEVPVLEARNAAKSFGATRALVDGNLVVHRGEVIAPW
jgi:ABC-type sugar transport system ATPase subunit